MTLSTEQKKAKLDLLKARDVTATKTEEFRTKSAEYLSKGDMANTSRISSLMPPTDPKKIVLAAELQYTSSGDVHGVVEQIVDEDEISRELDEGTKDIDSSGQIVEVT